MIGAERPGLDVGAQPLLQIGHRLGQAFQQQRIAAFDGIGAEAAVRRLHPGDDA